MKNDVCKSINSKTETIYRNNSINASVVGWDKLTEFCSGNRSYPFVVHNHVKGTFRFVWDIPWDMEAK